MKKTILLHNEVADLLAEHYVSKGSGTTIFEVPIKSAATVGEIARFSDIGAERVVLAGRTSKAMKVLLFSAEDWQALRGTKPAAARK